MKQLPDLIGQKFGRLTVVCLINRTPGTGRRWLCKCDCGFECVRETRVLRDKSHVNKSCGCAKRDSIRKASAAALATTTKFSHPHKVKLKWLYRNMVNRCHKPGTRRYERYGGRGISVCDEWRRSPTAFYTWAAASGYSPELSIERKNRDGNYCPENCCFTDRKAQANNTSRNKFLVWRGESKTIALWAEQLQISPGILWKRLARGWTVDKTLTVSARH